MQNSQKRKKNQYCQKTKLSKNSRKNEENPKYKKFTKIRKNNIKKLNIFKSKNQITSKITKISKLN